MRLEGVQTIGADREAVWAALNDAATLRASIPGCQSLEGNPEQGFEAVVKQKIGPVSATFRGKVALTERVPPESYRIEGQGEGGAAGFAKGAADVRLTESAGGTELAYAVEARVGGKLAQLGARLIDGVARKLADDFFARFKAEVEGRDLEAASRYAAATAASAPGPGEDDGDAVEGGDAASRPGLWKRITG